MLLRGYYFNVSAGVGFISFWDCYYGWSFVRIADKSYYARDNSNITIEEAVGRGQQ